MSRKIRDSGTSRPRLRDPGGHLPKLDSALVAKALGAEPAEVQVDVRQGPVSLSAVRVEVVRRLARGGTTAAQQCSLRAALVAAFHRWLADWLPEQAERSAAAALQNAGGGDPTRAAEVAREIALRVLAEVDRPQPTADAAVPFSWDEAGASVEKWLSRLVGTTARQVVRAS